MKHEETTAAVAPPFEQGVVPLAPKRVQLSRAKGWRMPENTVKVDRATRYGNPFRDSEHDRYGEASIELSNGMRQIVDDWWTAPVVVRLFEQWMTGSLIQEPSFLEPRELVARKWLRTAPDLAPLRGKNLACWCKPGGACHADVLLLLANPERHNVEANRPDTAATPKYGAPPSPADKWVTIPRTRLAELEALESDLLEAKGYLEELDRENDRLRAANRARLLGPNDGIEAPYSIGSGAGLGPVQKIGGL